MNISDMTLQQYLLAEVGGKPLETLDRASLEAINERGCARGARIDANSFEHIRIKKEEPITLSIIKIIVEHYYKKLDYHLNNLSDGPRTFFVMATNGNETLMIIGLLESEFVVNISAQGPKPSY
ncbi:MAG: hypothetical protein WCI52_00750 [bacterium]